MISMVAMDVWGAIDHMKSMFGVHCMKTYGGWWIWLKGRVGCAVMMTDGQW